MNTSSDRQSFREMVAEVAAKAKAKLPQAVNGRVESAVKLVLMHDVCFHEDGTVEVGSASDPMKTYTVAASACDCQDFAYGKAPQGWCQHRLAAAIARRVGELLPPVPEMVEPWPETDADHPAPVSPAVPLPEAPHGIDPHYLTTIQGRPFIRFEGLLALAHERGLVAMETTVVHVTSDWAVCQSTARFQDGRVFTDIGDASPTNVQKHLAPHFCRMAATRASARALRRALNIDLCAVEELGDE